MKRCFATRKDIPRDFLSYLTILEELSAHPNCTSTRLVARLRLDRFYVYSLLDMLRREGHVTREPIDVKRPGGPKYTFRCTPSGSAFHDGLLETLRSLVGWDHPTPARERQPGMNESEMELDDGIGFTLSEELGFVIQEYIDDGSLVTKLVKECVEVVLSTLRK